MIQGPSHSNAGESMTLWYIRHRVHEAMVRECANASSEELDYTRLENRDQGCGFVGFEAFLGRWGWAR